MILKISSLVRGAWNSFECREQSLRDERLVLESSFGRFFRRKGKRVPCGAEGTCTPADNAFDNIGVVVEVLKPFDDN